MGNYFQLALGKVIGTKNERELKRLSEHVEAINALEPELERLPDSEFPLRTAGLKQRLAEGASLQDLLPEAFAIATTFNRTVYDALYVALAVRSRPNPHCRPWGSRCAAQAGAMASTRCCWETTASRARPRRSATRPARSCSSASSVASA